MIFQEQQHNNMSDQITPIQEQGVSIKRGMCEVLPLEIPRNFDAKMQHFSFSWEELRAVLEKELSHFAVKIGDGTIRVFTHACCFTIDLNSARASVSLPESVWMMELATRTQQRDKANASRDEARVNLDVERRWRNELIASRRDLMQMLDETKLILWQEQEDLERITRQLRAAQRAKMKLVRKFKAVNKQSSQTPTQQQQHP